MTTDAGIPQCFSQAIGSATPTGGADAGTTTVTPPSEGWGAGGGSSDGGPTVTCSGSESSCSCDETVNGEVYALDCYVSSSGAVSCSCTINGAPTPQTASVDSCMDSNAVQNAFSASSGCGFSF
jgi:hypothetical protein